MHYANANAEPPPLAAPPSRRALFVGMLQVALSSFGGGLSLIHISEPTRPY